MSTDSVDAVVIGSGPNGLVAAIALARRGWRVQVLERAPVAGGAVRSAELFPGYTHDTHSAFYGLLHASPVFRPLGLDRAVPWAHFDVPVGALVGPDRGASMHRDAGRSAAALAKIAPEDGDAWAGWCRWWERIGARFLQTMLAPVGSPRPALRLLRRTRISGAFDLAKTLLEPVETLAARSFASEEARALFVSGASHADIPIDATGSAPSTLILAFLGQFWGMPVPVGGAGRLADAFVRLLDIAGGRVRTGDAVTRIAVERGRAVAVETESGFAVRARHAVVCDTGPGALVRLAGAEAFPGRFLDGLRRHRYGTGMFKVDVALSSPPSWRAEEMNRCGVVHVTGTLDDMARAAHQSMRGMLPARPMLVVGQQTVADATRAPAGGATLWIETHVPPEPRADAATGRDVGGWAEAREPFLERVLALLEEHAPGLRARIVGSAVRAPADLEAENPNLVGGDVGGGSAAIDQQLVLRPVPGWFRYRTPVKGLYLCSASAHPGGGVHGMGGWNCARAVLRDGMRPGAVVRTAGGARRLPRRG